MVGEETCFSTTCFLIWGCHMTVDRSNGGINVSSAYLNVAIVRDRKLSCRSNVIRRSFWISSFSLFPYSQETDDVKKLTLSRITFVHPWERTRELAGILLIIGLFGCFTSRKPSESHACVNRLLEKEKKKERILFDITPHADCPSCTITSPPSYQITPLTFFLLSNEKFVQFHLEIFRSRSGCRSCARCEKGLTNKWFRGKKCKIKFNAWITHMDWRRSRITNRKKRVWVRSIAQP